MQRRADARRLAILRAAARVFRDRGFAAAGMRDIAVAADLSPANLYHYFRGKDELLFFCQDRTLERLLAALAQASADPGPLAARLRGLAAAHVSSLVDGVEGSAAHFEVDALPARLRALVVAKRDRYERGIRTLVAAGMRRGELRAADATVATRAFLGALNWTASWFRPEGPYSPEQIAEARAKAEEKVKSLHVPANRVYVHYLEVVGPYNEKMDPAPESRNLIFICRHQNQHSANCPKLIVSRFASRAFRRLAALM